MPYKKRKLVTKCSYCKKYRDPRGNWRDWMEGLNEVAVSHGICKNCYEDLAVQYDFLDAVQKSKKTKEDKNVLEVEIAPPKNNRNDLF